MREVFDAAVVGGGPGGLIAALYLKRFNRNVVLISKGEPRAAWIPSIRNLIGYRERISGVQLLKKITRQLTDYNVPIFDGRASVTKHGRIFEINVEGKKIRARKVVLATGMKDIQPEGIHNLKELTAEGVVGYCAICDGFEHTHKKVALLVQDVRGLRKIPVLLNFTPNLKIIYTGRKPLAPHWQALIKKHGLELRKGPLRSLQLVNDGIIARVGQRQVKADFMYVALGSEVPREAFRHIRSLKRTRSGFIRTNSHQETSVKGLYAVGDCVNSLSQVSVAIGQAAIAATHIHNQSLE